MKAFLVALVVCLSCVAQGKDQPVLKITIDGWGVVWPQGKHNYLTVWPDGTVMYLEKAKKRGLTAQVDDRISEATRDKLQDAIREAAKPSANRPASSLPIDYRLTVHMEASQGWTLDMPHFDFDRPDTVSPAVYRLLCVADSIREEPERLTKPANCDKAL